MSPALSARLSWLFALLLLTACAATTPPHTADPGRLSAWRGRLALQVQAGADNSQVQSLTTSFELSGTEQQGELRLYTPLGMTAVELDWNAQEAVLRRHGEVHRFASLNDLISFTLGTQVPVAALFAWLSGEPVSAAGWSPDLSRHASGHILARREQPAPIAEIRLVLEK